MNGWLLAWAIIATWLALVELILLFLAGGRGPEIRYREIDTDNWLDVEFDDEPLTLEGQELRDRGRYGG